MATIAPPIRAELNAERRFFFGLAIALALTTFIGFAPTYYLVGYFDGVTTRGDRAASILTPAVHLHGLTGSLWMLLLVAQTGLVAADRRDIHKRMGIIAVALMVAISITAWIVSFEAGGRGKAPPGWTPPGFLLIQIGTLAGFLIFATLGLLMRKRSDFHKRLMMLATISMMVPVCGRIWTRLGGIEYTRGAVGGMILSDLFLLAIILFDIRSRGRIHPVTLWGGALLVGLQIGRVMAAGTEEWQIIGRWLHATF
ncbi:MAG TPA: hypothetical protein VGN36_05340 [Sphingorhabdus sp.]|jgi:uncharacterized membrane protein YozB (DUF420 family)|nr:hypothetical protein [Sphingorhabdus sp.]